MSRPTSLSILSENGANHITPPSSLSFIPGEKNTRRVMGFFESLRISG